MPALVAFGRRWQVGSDDFVVPGILDLLIRSAWLLAAVVIYWQNETNLNFECEGGLYIKMYLYGVFACSTLIIFSAISLVFNSKAGGIMDTNARKYVPLCIYIRFILEIYHIALNILGTVFLYSGSYQINCPSAADAQILIQGLVICDWLLLSICIVILMFIYDPLGGYKYTVVPNTQIDPKFGAAWKKRCQLLCCYWGGKNDLMDSTFEEIGYYFAGFFEDVDLVPSDVAAGIMLQFLRHDRKSRVFKGVSIKHCNPGNENFFVGASVTKEPGKFIGPATDNWTSLSLLSHYTKYAMSPGAWRMLAISRSHHLKDLWKDIFCCGCLPGRSHPLNIEGDSCCYLQTAGMKEFLQIDNEDILYANFHNDYFQIPFVVAVDHPTKSVVLAMRGTLTLPDYVVDMLMTPTPLNINGLPESLKAHHGMLIGARNIKKLLDDMKILPKAFATYPDYNLVTTGHSLGAAAATLLGIMLRSEYPTLKCYAYSPPGCLLSLDAAKYCESFVVTLLYNDDWTARWTTASTERLKYKMIKTMTDCSIPKYRVLFGGCFGLPGFFGAPFPEDLFKEKKLKYSNSFKRTPQPEPTNILQEESESESEVNEIQNPINSFQNPQEQPAIRKRLVFEDMYLPGRLLHITETPAFDLGHKNPHYSDELRWEIRWAEREEFEDIITTPRFYADHVPFRLMKALQDFVQRTGSINIVANTRNSS